MKTSLLCLCIISLSLLHSCSPVVYSTAGHVVPLFRDKGEATVSGGFALTDDGAGYNVQATGAITNKWALLTSFYSLSSGGSSDGWSGNGNYFEAGAGRFGSFSADKDFIYEVFAGIGFAGIKNSNENSTLNVNFTKPFIQPSIGFSKKWIDVAITPRFGIVSYSNHEIQTTDNLFQMGAENYFDNQKTTFVFEPGLTIRGGFKNLKLQLQYNVSTFSNSVDNTNSNFNANINNQYLGVGLHYLFSKRYQ